MGSLCQRLNKPSAQSEASSESKTSVAPLDDVKAIVPEAKKAVDYLEAEEEISTGSYSSKPDKTFSVLESKFNLLQDIKFSDFIYSLYNFSLENATLKDDYSDKPKSYSKNDEFYSLDFSEDILQSFIENKILKHDNLYKKAGEDETLASTFKEMFKFLRSSLILKLKGDLKEKHIEVPTSIFKKHHAAEIGLLYCGGKKVSKIKFIFDLFAVDGKISNSDDLREFLLSLFLIPSYCMLSARKKISGVNQEISELSNDDVKELVDCCELKDSQNLVQVFSQNVFPSEDTSLTYEEFKNKFKKGENSIGWLISPKGIREYLEKNNV